MTMYGVPSNDVAMLKPGDRLGLALEPGSSRRIEREVDVHHLDRDVSFEHGIAGAIQHTHAATAHEADDLVAADGLRDGRHWPDFLSYAVLAPDRPIQVSRPVQ
jgi:hypothetical protein